MLLFNAMPRLMERLGYGRVSWNTEIFFFLRNCSRVSDFLIAFFNRLR